jgi:hypothetical protein
VPPVPCTYLRMCAVRSVGCMIRVAAAGFGLLTYLLTTSAGALKDYQSQFFSKTACLTPIFEVIIVIYDQKHVWNEFLKTFNAHHRHRSLLSPPLARLLAAMARRRRHRPSQGHGSSPAALHQKPWCMTDSRDSIMPVQFSSLPDFDAEPPAVPAPQRVMLHPHRLHISTNRELLAYPWWTYVSATTGSPQDISQKPHDSS